MTPQQIQEAEQNFEKAKTAAYTANLAYASDPTPANHAMARRLNRAATAAAYASHDAREHSGGPCDCQARRARVARRGRR